MTPADRAAVHDVETLLGEVECLRDMLVEIADTLGAEGVDLCAILERVHVLMRAEVEVARMHAALPPAAEEDLDAATAIADLARALRVTPHGEPGEWAELIERVAHEVKRGEDAVKELTLLHLEMACERVRQPADAPPQY